MSDLASSFGRTAPWRAKEAAGPSLRDVVMQAFYAHRLILGCLLAGLLAGMAAAVVNRPTYTAEALLLVRADAGESVRDGVAGPASAASGEAVQRLLQSDIQILKSEPVVTMAARAAPLPGRDSTALERFRKALKVEALPTSNIIRVAFQSPDRARSLAAVQAVIDAYRQRRTALYRSDSQEVQSDEIARAAHQIDDLDAQIQQVRDRYGVLDIAQDISLASARLDGLRQRAGQVGERAAAAAAELAATRQGLAATPERVLDSLESSNAAPNDEARNTLLRLRQEREHLAAQYAPGWPALEEIDRKIAAAAAQVAANAKDRYRSDRTVRSPLHDQLDQRRAALLVEGQSLARQNSALSQEIAGAAARVAALRQADAELRALARSREVAEGLYKQLALARAGARLEDEVVDRRDGALRVVQPPSAPLKGRDLGPTLVLAGLLAGLGAGIAAASLSGLLRQVFLTPGEAERALKLASLGEVEATDLELGAKRLAAVLEDAEVDGAPVRVVQLVGVERGARSALAVALASALAGRTGANAAKPVRVLLADLDGEARLRRRAPAGRRLALDQGLLTVAQGSQPGVWVALDLAASPLGDPGAETEIARAFLKQLRAGFDWVILAAESDFAAYEARRRFPLADVNVVVIEAEATRAVAARTLIETVLASGGDLLGFVFAQRRFHIPRVLMKWL